MTSIDWGRTWRGSGIGAVVFFVAAYVIGGVQPKVGASPAALVSFYDGDRARILIATVILGFAVLNLLWFAAALASVLRDAGRGGWANAATAASAALGALLFLRVTVDATLAYSVAGSGAHEFASGLNDLSWVLAVLSFFPAAMLIMAGSFGLWRAGIFSNASFAAGVTAMAVLLAGTTTWATDGVWAVDGAYARLAAPIVALAWVAVVSGFLARRAPAPSTVGTRDSAVVHAA
jgi:hypothetical protein